MFFLVSMFVVPILIAIVLVAAYYWTLKSLFKKPIVGKSLWTIIGIVIVAGMLSALIPSNGSLWWLNPIAYLALLGFGFRKKFALSDKETIIIVGIGALAFAIQFLIAYGILLYLMR